MKDTDEITRYYVYKCYDRHDNRADAFYVGYACGSIHDWRKILTHYKMTDNNRIDDVAETLEAIDKLSFTDLRKLVANFDDTINEAEQNNCCNLPAPILSYGSASKYVEELDCQVNIAISDTKAHWLSQFDKKPEFQQLCLIDCMNASMNL